MLPLRDENPTVHTSVAMVLILAANVAVWIVVQGLGSPEPLIRSICSWGLIPGELLGTVKPGTVIPLSREFACVIEDRANWWTLVTSMFLHGSWMHLLGNMWFLWIFGDNVEDAMGPVRFTLFYLLCGLAAAAAQMLSNPYSPIPMVGASGAIGGVMGAYAVLFPTRPVQTLIFLGLWTRVVVMPAFVMLGYWFLLQLLGTMLSVGPASGGVAFWAHVGGFLAGVALVRPLCNPRRLAACRRRRPSRAFW